MPILRKIPCIGFLLLCAAILLPAAERPVAVGNPGFEEAGPDGQPLGWHIPAGGAVARAAAAHDGRASLAFTHGRPGQTTVYSQPLDLQVGKLYRLGGWIRSEAAVADPTGRYPTPVAATLSMESFPFTEHSPAVGGSRDWTRVEMYFLATRAKDRIALNFGTNGSAVGQVWFDDIELAESDDIAAFIPPDTVRWYGPAFRYTDRGWIYVHIEGKPYDRGVQYGWLLAAEICTYIDKLAVRENTDNPGAGWNQLRLVADSLMLRQYDPEFLEEMKGIADGVAKRRQLPKCKFEAVDLLDIVTINSAVDIGQLAEAVRRTPHLLSGRSFLHAEEEQQLNERLHKCSGFLANGPASRDGRVVFGQLFMWNGYTGVHFNVVCDVQPARGHRLVYQTFPGGIHSGADFYLNSAGIVMGETTVQQTPFAIGGEPQSSRIRKAAQYASSIDDVVRILTTRNNGLYTNDWLIADSKTNETAILLLGTRKYKLWRSGRKDFPGGTDGFYWSVNNAKDPEVRKEYVANPANSPFDLPFSPSNRDVAFLQFYRTFRGRFDGATAAAMWNTSPLNRPHACDGKITTGEMMDHMMFLAHYGKVTLREKFPFKTSRLMPELPNAIPHLTLGYSTFSPIFVTERLKALKAAETPAQPLSPADVVTAVKDSLTFDRQRLWLNTVYPANPADNALASGDAAYWNLLNNAPDDARAAAAYWTEKLTDTSNSLLYIYSREGARNGIPAEVQYDRYGAYRVPRVRGTYALHQLRLLLGNETFARVLEAVHGQYHEKPCTTAQWIAAAEKAAGRPLDGFIRPWLERDDLPRPRLQGRIEADGAAWRIVLNVRQEGRPYHFLCHLAVNSAAGRVWRKVEVQGENTELTWTVSDKPISLDFNCAGDIPVARRNFYSLTNMFDDFSRLRIVYGTSRQIEANHTLALNYDTVLADVFTEVLPPVVRDSEIRADEITASDLVLLGGTADNELVRRMAPALGLELGKNRFVWRGKAYTEEDDGLMVVLPHPDDPQRVVYLWVANSALQLHQMTKAHQGLPSWAVFKGERVAEKGHHPAEGMEIRF